MLYIFMLLLSCIPIAMGVYVFWIFKNYDKIKEKRRKIYEKPVEKKYIYSRCSNSVREEMGKIKSISDYYKSEEKIYIP